VASWRCVRPILTMSANSLAFGIESVTKVFHGGSRRREVSVAAAMCMAAGNVSLERLRHVDVVVRMDGLLAAQFAAGDFNGAIGDDLVHVHVGLRAAAVCQTRRGKCSLSFPSMTSSAARMMRLHFSCGSLPKSWFNKRGGFFEDAEGADELGRHQVFADGEVDERAGGLRAVVAVRGDFDLAHESDSVRVGVEAAGLAASDIGDSLKGCCQFYQQVAGG